MDQEKDEDLFYHTPFCLTRREIMTGSAALLVGGVAGRSSNAIAAPAPTVTPAPPLPWKWTKLDPMEAGTRAYQTYLKSKG